MDGTKPSFNKKNILKLDHTNIFILFKTIHNVVGSENIVYETHLNSKVKCA